MRATGIQAQQFNLNFHTAGRQSGSYPNQWRQESWREVVRFDETEARVNGKDAGILWKQPFDAMIDHLLKKRENRLRIAVANLWNNRIVGDLHPDAKRAFTRTNIKATFPAGPPLLPSGVFGPVILRFPVSVTLQSQP